MGIFKNTYKELDIILNSTFYEKICPIAFLYIKLKIDCENKKNKNYLIGKYKLLNMNDNKIKCYNLAYGFITNINNN